MSLSRRSLSMPPAIQRARTAPRKLTSTIRALEPWKYRKLLHQGKNEKNGIAEAIPFLSCPTMFSYREAPLEVSFCYSVLTFRFLLACIQFLFYLVNSIYQPLNLNGRFFRMKNSKRHSIIPLYWNDSDQWMNTFPALECQ